MQAVSVILVAAGTASRMNGIDKQLTELNGFPVFYHSIRTFSSLEEVCEIIVVTREETLPRMKAYTDEYTLSKPVHYVVGGATRQDSVLAGLCAASERSRLIAIHDGARPLVDTGAVRAVFADAERYGAATLGVAVKDTIKLTDPERRITSTPPRDLLYQIQTPQVFDKALYREGVRHAQASGKNFTDDCQLIEAIGHRVIVTPGSYRNIKITTPEDILVAQAFLSGCETINEDAETERM